MRRSHRFLAARARAGLRDGLLAVFLLMLLACGRQHARPAELEKTSETEDLLRSYPPGPWRLARHELNGVFLTLSHVLVGHEGSQSGEHSELRAPGWSAERPARRSRDEARALAASIAARARSAPNQFDALAREYSDDLTNRERGGSLGTWCAADLPPTFLDALNIMQPGEISRVVETALGFHILQRRPTPPESKIAARRIVVSHRSAAVILQRRNVPIERDRDEAERLAKRIAAEASADPERFQQLVELYSDHADALRGGDFGVWSNHERSPRLAPRYREVDAIAALKVGEVSDPIEGDEGFNIFLRTEAAARPLLAVTYLRVSFDARAPAGTVDKQQLPLFPADVRPLLQGRTRDFDKLQRKYCCNTMTQWRQGRGDPRVEQLIGALDVGDVTPRPLQIGKNTFEFFKRVAPELEQAVPHATSELPRSTAPDVDAIVGRVQRGNDVSAFVQSLQKVYGEGLGLRLDPEKQRQCSIILSRFAEDVRTRPATERMATLNDARGRLKAVLSPQEYADLQANVRSELTRTLMGAR